jgi:hypothetical protein
MSRSRAVFGLGIVLWASVVAAQVAPYDPYAEYREAPPPVLPDGTLHWGTFFKSAALERSYQRLWSLGACRGSNRAITVPVARNKVLIDRLPESEFEGVVLQGSGTLAGGVIAFTDRVGQADAPVFFAQLHPAGVSRLQVVGSATPASLVPGLVVRVRTTIDADGRAAEPITALEVITPPSDFVPDAVRPGARGDVVGRLVRVRKGEIHLHVAAGRVRRLVMPVADEAEVFVDAAEPMLIAPGDVIEVKGRLWDGDGTVGAGMIFSSRVIVRKSVPEAASPAGADTAGLTVAAPGAGS